MFEPQGPVCGATFVFDGLGAGVSQSWIDERNVLRTIFPNCSRLSDESSNVT